MSAGIEEVLLMNEARSAPTHHTHTTKQETQPNEHAPDA